MDSSRESILSMSESITRDLIQSLPEAAHLKDFKTKKYITSNENNLKIYGLNKPDQIVGLTVYDLNEFMKPFWGSNFANQVNDLDQQVASTFKVIADKNRMFLDKFGLVHVQDMIKSPVVNSSNKVTSILTISFEVTERLNKFIIFDMYRKIYEKSKMACLYFMMHLKIKDFFRDLLSAKELFCLLHLLEKKTYKCISKEMNISVKTVETHIRNMNNKLCCGDIFQVINFIRMSSNGQR